MNKAEILGIIVVVFALAAAYIVEQREVYAQEQEYEIVLEELYQQCVDKMEWEPDHQWVTELCTRRIDAIR